MSKKQKHLLVLVSAFALAFGEYPKVCVNLQTDVR